MDKIKIIIVDDHQLFRNGLKYILSQNEGFEIIGEASDGAQFLELLKYITPDIVLMDINMPVLNGIEATKRALKQHPELKILVLTMFSEQEYYNHMIEIGAKGFILKDADNSELITAIQRISQGYTYFSQQLLLQLIRNKTQDNSINLTDREQEVLEQICIGFSTQEIADKLNISLRTVERHRSNLLMKTESNNSVKLVVYAIKHNLVKI